MSEVVYPLIEKDTRGWRIRVSQGAYMPGVYLNYLQAQKAVLSYLGRAAEAKQSKLKKDK